jgi:hypothetical protein
MTESANGGRDRALHGPHDCRGEFEYGTNVTLPCRHLDQPVHGVKLTPEVFDPVVLFSFDSQHQLFESMILIVDRLLDHVDSVLQVAKNATH